MRTPEGELLREVSVLAVNASGIHELGETVDLGFTIETSRLQDLEPYVLVFCHRDFPCTAEIVDERLYQFREMNLHLPPAIFY